jgi:glycerol uptake facilitator-like aquaporin
MNILAILVEFMGTFILLSVIVASGSPLMIGATLATLIYLGTAVSGAHFNPATTVMTLANRGIAGDNAAAYILAQVAAAVAAVTVYNKLKKQRVL